MNDKELENIIANLPDDKIWVDNDAVRNKLIELNLLKETNERFDELTSRGLKLKELKTFRKLKKFENEKQNKNVINADNLIIGDNYGNQSSKSHLYNPTIENDITKPINKASDIWSFKNIMFAIITGLIVASIVYIISILN